MTASRLQRFCRTFNKLLFEARVPIRNERYDVSDCCVGSGLPASECRLPAGKHGVRRLPGPARIWRTSCARLRRRSGDGLQTPAQRRLCGSLQCSYLIPRCAEARRLPASDPSIADELPLRPRDGAGMTSQTETSVADHTCARRAPQIIDEGRPRGAAADADAVTPVTAKFRVLCQNRRYWE
jgi:hypothetical protein